MRVKFLFFTLVFLLVLLGIALAFFKELAPFHLLLAEGGLCCAIALLLIVYQRVIKPMNVVDYGMELLREQDFSSRLGLVGQYEADRIVNIFNRMMDQLRNERLRLREQNHFLDLLIQASPMGVVVLTFDGEISEVNPVAVKMIGLRKEDICGKRMEQLDSSLALKLAAIPRESTAVIHLNDANVYKCSHSYFIDHGFKHPFYLIEKMTDEVIKVEKRAYEKVIRMIAHEVNNTTAGITSTLDTVGQALSSEQGMEDICNVMHVCVERCFSMSRFITRFADVVKIPEPVLLPVELNEVAAACKRFMEGACAERGIELLLECDGQAGKVLMDASLFEQVLVNIIKNAMESIGQDGRSQRPQPGRIVVRTKAPSYIEIEDNGPGISKDSESKLFTPFYSTKPKGQGIGLVFIREVLVRHGCAFSLRTYADGLTRFCIMFD